MKKYLALASALLCAASLTACHDDGDDDDDVQDYVADFTSAAKVSYIPGAQTAASKVGLNAFMLSDNQGKTDVACYMYADESEITEGYVIDEEKFENFYGGFCPTGFSADDPSWDPYRPITDAYHSGSGALVCNPGTLCRPLFTRRHFAADLGAVSSQLTLGDMKGLWVCPTAQYAKLKTAEGRSELGISSSVKNVQIRFYIYAYINSLSLGKLSEIIDMLKTNLKESDTRAKNYVVLAECDANGEWSVAEGWKYLDLEDVEDFYVFEATISAVDKSTGKTVSTIELQGDDVEDSNKLNYCMVDDITVESKSLF
ncbi:MAG: hypothetical protein II375_08940 [Bacteroidales bacterium]|nr:hypothetical protein [Bacteroidales bacterium]